MLESMIQYNELVRLFDDGMSTIIAIVMSEGT